MRVAVRVERGGNESTTRHDYEQKKGGRQAIKALEEQREASPLVSERRSRAEGETLHRQRREWRYRTRCRPA